MKNNINSKSVSSHYNNIEQLLAFFLTSNNKKQNNNNKAKSKYAKFNHYNKDSICYVVFY